LFDEGLPFRFVAFLRAEGHDVTVCGQDHPQAGVILFRLGYVPIELRLPYLRRVLVVHAERLDQFIVVSPHGSRIALANL
jgi:hypothetical protein